MGFSFARRMRQKRERSWQYERTCKRTVSERQRPSRFERGDDVVVMKFGGTSVEDAAAIRRLIGIVRNKIVRSRLGARPVVVVSALARVTDQLLEAGTRRRRVTSGSALATVRDIYVRHEQLADSLVDGSAYSTSRSRIARRVPGAGIAAARLGQLSSTGSQGAGPSARLRGMLFEPAGEGSSLRGWNPGSAR